MDEVEGLAVFVADGKEFGSWVVPFGSADGLWSFCGSANGFLGQRTRMMLVVVAAVVYLGASLHERTFVY